MISRRSLIRSAVALVGPVAIGRAGSSSAIAPVGSVVLRQADEPGFRVLFIRHGESEINVLDPDLDDQDLEPDDGTTYPLTRRGVEQVMELADLLADVPLSAILTSTQLRGVQTAAAIAMRRGIEFTPESGLAEIDFGTLTDFDAMFDVMDRWASGDDEAGLAGGESLRELKERFLPVIMEAIEEYSNRPEALIVISHGALLMTMLPHLFANVSVDFAMGNGLPNTGIIEGRIVDDDFVCTSWLGLQPE